MALKKREFTPESGTVDTYASVKITVMEYIKLIYYHVIVVSWVVPVLMFVQVPRLREPRQLYGLNAHEFGPQQLARWYEATFVFYYHRNDCHNNI